MTYLPSHPYSHAIYHLHPTALRVPVPDAVVAGWSDMATNGASALRRMPRMAVRRQRARLTTHTAEIYPSKREQREKREAQALGLWLPHRPAGAQWR